MQNDYQARQKAILTSEIRILEKQKSDIEYELLRIEATKKEEYTQYTKEIKDLTKRKNELLEQVERLRDDMTTLTTAYNTAKESIEAVTTRLETDAKEELRIAKLAAEKIITDANIERREAEELMEKAKRLHRETEEFKEVVDRHAADNVAANNLLATRQKVDLERHQLARDRLQKLINDEEILKTSIRDLEEEKVQLEANIAKHRENHEAKLHEWEEREKKLIYDERSSSQREKLLDLSEKELKEEARKITDRRATLDRAVEEMKKKGAKI